MVKTIDIAEIAMHKNRVRMMTDGVRESLLLRSLLLPGRSGFIKKKNVKTISLNKRSCQDLPNKNNNKIPKKQK